MNSHLENSATTHVGDGAVLNDNRQWLTLPSVSKEWTIITVLFVLLLLSMTVNGLDYARGSRIDEALRQTLNHSNERVRDSDKKVADVEEELRQAKVDLKTQVWLRSDTLTKENADLRGHYIAIEDLVQAYGMQRRNTYRPPPLLEEIHK
jgi:hypothetical protein